MIVVADDLTGAAEIAAVAHTRGLDPLILRPPFETKAPDRHLILDTDSRLASHEQAERSTAQAAQLISELPGQTVFKKVDSLLRGNVAVEIQTLAKYLQLPRTFLLPANPSSRRTLTDRLYRIDGKPLHLTEFANDPTHPAHSSDPIELLGNVFDTQIHYCALRDELPQAGIVICESGTLEDVRAWAAIAERSDLLAGARDFFEAVLMQSAHEPTRVPSEAELPSFPCLVLQGSLSPQRGRLHEHLADAPYERVRLSPIYNSEQTLTHSIETLIASLHQNRLATLEFEPTSAPTARAAPEINRCLSVLAESLASHTGLRFHLAIEGGATAATLLQTLRVRQLETRHCWAPGVVSLQPTDPALPCLVTTKPGSYPWPTSFLGRLLHPQNA